MSEKKITKKVAELASWYGSPYFDPVYSKYRPLEKLCLFVSRWYYRLTEGLYFKLKYFFQRMLRGYDDLDKWNAGWYIARKAIPVLKDFREKFHGTSLKWHREDRFNNIIELTKDEVFVEGEDPISLTEDEWRGVLDDIIFVFEFTLDQDEPDKEFNEDEYNKRYKRYKRGLKLFSIYYGNLWD